MVFRYSICITNYNTINSIQESLERILNQIDPTYEVIVVDNNSTDGSLSILSKYAETGKLRLISRHTTRGAALQITLHEATGEYVIKVDMDDLWRPVLRKILHYYHTNYEGKALFAKGFAIAPRKLLISVGGWRDLPRAVDSDIMIRLARIGKCVYLPVNPAIEREVRKWNVFMRLIDGYNAQVSMLRLGIRYSAFRFDLSYGYGILGSIAFVWVAIVARFTYRLWPVFRYPEGANFETLLNAISVSGDEILTLKKYLSTQTNNSHDRSLH